MPPSLHASRADRRSARLCAFGLAAGALALAFAALFTRGSVAGGSSAAPEIDARTAYLEGFSARPNPAQEKAIEALRGRVPALVALRDRATGAVTTLLNHAGYLTPERPDAPALTVALEFVREQRRLLGLPEEDLAAAEVTAAAMPGDEQTMEVVLTQSCYGVPLYQGELRVTVASQGQVAKVRNGFLPGLCRVAGAPLPVISAQEARTAAAAGAGLEATNEGAELVWLGVRAGLARLAWHVELNGHPSGLIDAVVDARTGGLWLMEVREPAPDPTADSAVEIAALTPCAGGSAGGFPCRGVDLLSRLPLSAFPGPPSGASSIWGFRDLNDNREYAVIGLRNGTGVVDVTDPVNPRLVGHIAGVSSSWREVKVYQFRNTTTGRWNAYAYISTEGSGGGIQIINLTQLPNSVSLANTYRGLSTSHSLFISNVDYATGVANDPAFPPFLYINGSNLGGFRILSLANPTQLSEAGAGTGTYAHEVYTHVFRDARASQCAPGHNPCEVVFNFAGSPGIRVWDVTNKSAPVLLSSFTYPNLAFCHSGWISRNTNSLFVNDEIDESRTGANTRILTVNLANLRALSLSNQYFGPTKATDHNAFAVGDKVYYSSYRRGLAILDVTNPNAPVETGFFDTVPSSDAAGTSGAWGSYPFLPSGTQLISDVPGGLFVLREQSAGQVVFTDDFEANRGWTVNPNGSDTATAGRWERSDPQSTSSDGPKQLGTTTSGVNDLVTGRLAGASSGEHDIDGGVTSIQSPAITLPAGRTPTLSFRYYLAHRSNASSADFLRVQVVGATTQTVLERLGATTDVDAAWATASVNLGAFAGQTVRLRVLAADAGGGSLVEAAIDDIRITTP
jgi:choice-of-anchor B domain-containing protein